MRMTRPLAGLAAAAALTLLGLPVQAIAQPTPSSLWHQSVPVSNQVASSPVPGGGYPTPDGVYVPGRCGPGAMNSNRSESWIAVKRGTEDLVGTSKFFFDRYSTFYNFHLGSYTIPNGQVVANNQVQGYECTTVGTQAMPPSWTHNTDPNVAFDTRGRAYQVTLPFNAFWQNLHPNSAIMLSYSDDMGRHWVTGNGGRPLEQSPNASSKQVGHVEDKQWVAVNDIPGNRVPGPRVRGLGRLQRLGDQGPDGDLARPRADLRPGRSRSAPRPRSGPAVTYVYPSVDAAGTCTSRSSRSRRAGRRRRSTWPGPRDDGRTWSPFVAAVPDVGLLPARRPAEHHLPGRDRGELHREPDATPATST